jgi:hypothetical protein
MVEDIRIRDRIRIGLGINLVLQRYSISESLRVGLTAGLASKLGSSTVCPAVWGEGDQPHQGDCKTGSHVIVGESSPWNPPDHSPSWLPSLLVTLCLSGEDPVLLRL